MGKFCAYRSVGNMRCYREANHRENAHFLKRDTDPIFGDEKFMPEQPRRCLKWSTDLDFGKCQLPDGHAGDHNYEIVGRTAKSGEERCNVWGKLSGTKCAYVMDHTGMHKFPSQEADAPSRNLVLALPAATRPCKLSAGCSGHMEATMRKYASAAMPQLWWFCDTCKHMTSFDPKGVRLDKRVLGEELTEVPSTALVQATTEDAPEPGAASIAEAIEDSEEPAQSSTEAAMVASHMRDILAEK